MTVVYIDILLALNLFIDFLLLCATARVLQHPAKRGRLIGGALIGALSSLSILLPPLSMVPSLLYKLATAAFMILIAFPWRGPCNYIKQTAVLFIISTVFAGISFCLWYFLAPNGLLVQSGIVYYDVPPLLLVLLTTVSYAVLCLYDRLTRKRAALGFSYRIEIDDGNDRIHLRALLDSGHSLRESFSGAPVILVREDRIHTLVERYGIHTLTAENASLIRYIPYSSIGGEGILVSFRPRSVTLYADGKAVDISGVWIAPTAMLARGEYDALIGPATADILTASHSKKECCS